MNSKNTVYQLNEIKQFHYLKNEVTTKWNVNKILDI